MSLKPVKHDCPFCRCTEPLLLGDKHHDIYAEFGKDAPAPAQAGVEYRLLADKLATNAVDGWPSILTGPEATAIITTLYLHASPPLQPTPSAQPVMGSLFIRPFMKRFDVCLQLPSEALMVDCFTTEAAALAFIESCRPAQQDHSEDILDMVPAQPNGVPAGEADRRDGQRYRWLRENWYYEFEEPADPAVFPECARVVHTVDMEQMDEAVDTAIAQQKETVK